MSVDNDDFTKPSRQQKKRDAEAAQALGSELVKLSAVQLVSIIDKLDLPDKLREALLASRSIKSHEAHRRHLQYIGKLMRGIDTAPIQQALAEVKQGGQAAAAQLHQLERWRERLLSESNAAVDELLHRYPKADATHIQKLIANAHKESAQKQPPRAARLLFKYLRVLMEP